MWAIAFGLIFAVHARLLRSDVRNLTMHTWLRYVTYEDVWIVCSKEERTFNTNINSPSKLFFKQRYMDEQSVMLKFSKRNKSDIYAFSAITYFMQVTKGFIQQSSPVTTS